LSRSISWQPPAGFKLFVSNIPTTLDAQLRAAIHSGTFVHHRSSGSTLTHIKGVKWRRVACMTALVLRQFARRFGGYGVVVSCCVPPAGCGFVVYRDSSVPIAAITELNEGRLPEFTALN
jgi:hypothetical protein